MGVEGITNLDAVDPVGCLVTIGFAKFFGGTGGYARFVAICPAQSPFAATKGLVFNGPRRASRLRRRPVHPCRRSPTRSGETTRACLYRIQTPSRPRIAPTWEPWGALRRPEAKRRRGQNTPERGDRARRYPSGHAQRDQICG